MKSLKMMEIQGIISPTLAIFNEKSSYFWRISLSERVFIKVSIIMTRDRNRSDLEMKLFM